MYTSSSTISLLQTCPASMLSSTRRRGDVPGHWRLSNRPLSSGFDFDLVDLLSVGLADLTGLASVALPAGLAGLVSGGGREGCLASISLPAGLPSAGSASLPSPGAAAGFASAVAGAVTGVGAA